MCLAAFHELIADAMQFSELEFTVPTDDAIELLTAAHSHMQLQSLFTGSAGLRLMHTLLMAITRAGRSASERPYNSGRLEQCTSLSSTMIKPSATR